MARLVIFFIFLFAAVSWVFLGYLILNVPPKIDGEMVLANVLYALFSGFVAVWFTITLLHYLIFKFIQPKSSLPTDAGLNKKLFWPSARRGFLFSILVVGLTTLKVFELWNILNASLVVGIVILTEIYFSNR
jgi:hypothetical protein